MTKEEYWQKIKEGGHLDIFPTTVKKLEWWNEYWLAHPAEEAEAQLKIMQSHEKNSFDYMKHLIDLRIFFEENSTDHFGEFKLRQRYTYSP